MKKFLLITHYTPTKENYNGPSALMYHLLKNRPNSIELKIFTSNKNLAPQRIINESSANLNADISYIPLSLRNRILTSNKIAKVFRILKFHKLSADCYYALPASVLKQINLFNPDLIFLYPHTNLTIAQQLSKYKIIACGPDCVSLHYSRLLRDSFCFKNNIEKNILSQYHKRLMMEKSWNTINNTSLYLVGYTDTQYFNIINNKEKAFFFPHPHYELKDKIISFNHSPLKILISGKYDLYTYSDITNLINILENNKLDHSIKDSYSITFLGKKWEKLVHILKKANYNVSHKLWVDDYVSYISQFDIQLFPISVGSGTKGKVLDALSTGLLCIGSKYAFENIAVKNGTSCIMYNNINEIPKILKYILECKYDCEIIAQNGKNEIRKKHSPLLIINSIMEFYTNNEYKFEAKDYFKVDLK